MSCLPCGESRGGAESAAPNKCHKESVIPIALGVIALIAAISWGGIHYSHLAPLPTTFFEAYEAVTLSIAIGSFAVAGYARMKKREREVEIGEGGFSKQAKVNIHTWVANVHLDPRRFKVLGNSETPILAKVGRVRYVARLLTSNPVPYAEPLTKALQKSVVEWNSGEEELEENEKVDGAKFNRFVETSEMFSSSMPRIDGVEKERGRFELQVRENVEEKAQPIFQKGKWLHREDQANHGLEALAIFAETQLKRVGRLFTFYRHLRYFSRGEGEVEIYKRDQPTLRVERPTVQNVGHATLLFQMGEMNILTDPVFYDLSPVIYPRKTEPGITLEALPPIDVIILSHNHRDHCDQKALKQLANHQPVVLVPRGDFKLFTKLGFTQVYEHDWWTKTTVSCGEERVVFNAIPTRHWSGTGPFDGQHSLTCSWAFHLEGDEGAVYFRGDSAKIEPEWMEETADFVGVPLRANFEPGGPNHHRRWMESTHQSVLDSMVSHFEMGEEPERVETYLMHHNAFELGNDRFDEALIIKEGVLKFLQEECNFEGEAFKALPKFVQEELRGEFKKRIDKIGIENFMKEMKERFFSPKIGERLELPLNIHP